MIVVPCEQGSPEWIAARIGIPTASEAHKIITPGKLSLSSASQKYICKLIAEEMLQSSLDDFVSEWMERGTDLEDQAIACYELRRDVDTDRVGFILRDDEMFGCSPDRLVGDAGGLEIKCPSPAVHVENMIDMGTKYRIQCHASMWVTGRQWWDLLSWHPELPDALVRVERDEAICERMDDVFGRFISKLQEAREQLGIAEVAVG